MVDCMANHGFKPIWEEGARTHAVLSKVAELEGEVAYNPTQASIAKAQCGVDQEFQYQISGDESRASCGAKKTILSR